MLDSFILMAIGGFFLLLAPVFFLWARSEERALNYSLSQRRDLREFLTRWLQRAEPRALRVGGWLCLVIGLLLIVLGCVFLL